MSWRSGSTCYLVRESPDEIVAGIEAQLRASGLSVVSKPMVRGVRLRLARVHSLPAYEIGLVELRFARVGELTEVSVRGRQRRRAWVAVMLGGLGLLALIGDVIVAMGFASVELIKGAEQAQTHHRDNDPQLLHAVAGFLAPREVDRLDAAPFRRQLSGPG